MIKLIQFPRCAPDRAVVWSLIRRLVELGLKGKK